MSRYSRLLLIVPVLALLVVGSGCCCSPCGWLGRSNAVTPCCPCCPQPIEEKKEEKKK